MRAAKPEVAAAQEGGGRTDGSAPGADRPGADHSGAYRLGSDLIGKAGHPRNPISRTRIETVISRSVGGVSLVFALQAVPIMLAQLGERKAVGAITVSGALGLAIVLLVLATVVKRGVRVAAGSVSAIYLVALVAWPFLMLDPSAVLEGSPWLWYLCTVATSCAALAFPVAWAAIYTAAAPLAFGFLRTLPSGGQVGVLLGSLDAIYAMLLGQVVVIIIFMLRQAAASVDAAQTNALHKYAIAVRQHAREVERVEVDSIVHDCVLATLLSSAGARSPKQAELAAAMAANAIVRLEDASAMPATDETRIPFGALVDRITEAAAANSFTVIRRDIEFLTLPAHVSEALCAASVQAMVNSMQHAGPPDATLTRILTMRANPQGGCTIEITDSGVGFDPEEVSSERLGLRISIRERVASVGGSVSVRTSVGRGTTITIDWPGPGDQRALVGQFSAEELPILGLDRSSPDDGGAAA